LASELDARFAQRMRTRHREAFHPCHFLQPLNDIQIVIDYQRVCHHILVVNIFFSRATVLVVDVPGENVARARQERWVLA
jgi:hypothetical protein